MKEDNRNNSSWRQRLEGLDALPGESAPVLSSAWEKLHTKLEERPSRKVMLLWFAAAACVVLIFLVGTINREEEMAVEKITYIEKEPASKIVLYQPKSVITQKMAATKKPSTTKVIRSTKAITPDTIANIVADTAEMIPVLVKVDTPLLPAKKKLRVMHINELENSNVYKRDQIVRNSPSDKIIKINLAPSN